MFLKKKKSVRKFHRILSKKKKNLKKSDPRINFIKAGPVVTFCRRPKRYMIPFRSYRSHFHFCLHTLECGCCGRNSQSRFCTTLVVNLLPHWVHLNIQTLMTKTCTLTFSNCSRNLCLSHTLLVAIKIASEKSLFFDFSNFFSIFFIFFWMKRLAG